MMTCLRPALVLLVLLALLALVALGRSRSRPARNEPVSPEPQSAPAVDA